MQCYKTNVLILFAPSFFEPLLSSFYKFLHLHPPVVEFLQNFHKYVSNKNIL